MANWYKTAWGAWDPIMDDLDKKLKRRDPYQKDPRSLVDHAPFLGSDDKGDISKDPANRREKREDQFKKEVPPGRTILDDEIGQGEGANDNRFVSPEDIIPKTKNEIYEPIGAHNMHDRSIYDVISKKNRKFRHFGRI